MSNQGTIVQIIVALVLSAAATLIQQALAKRPEEQRKPGVRGEIQVGQRGLQIVDVVGLTRKLHREPVTEHH